MTTNETKKRPLPQTLDNDSVALTTSFQNRSTKRPLPDGWTWTTLGEVANPERNRVKPQDFAGLPFIGMDDVESETMHLLGTKSSGEMKSLSEHFWPDDVLYGSLRPYLNKVYRPDFEGLCSAEFIVFRSLPHLESKYLQYFLNQWSFVAFINKQNTGDRPRVKFGQMADYPFPLAPLPDQERIVAEIEKQFTRLDQAVASLRRLQSSLARYKASVLKAACEGRLVPQDPNDEPAADLLTRILAERRAQWQAANPGKKYKEVEGVGETAVLPDLPDGWVWARVDQLGEVRLGRQRSPKNHQGPHMHPYLRAANATWEGVDLSDVMEMNFSPKELEIYRLKQDDILLAEASGSANEVGKPFIWNEQIPDCCFQNTLIRVRLSNMPPNYLYFHFLKDAQTGRLGEIAKGVGIHHLGANRLAEMPVAIPPLSEQERIVAEVERRLSVVSAIEQTITANLARAERLRQSILHRAFTGQLV